MLPYLRIRAQLGHGNTVDAFTPRLVRSLQNFKVEQMSCSYYHSVVSCAGGHVFSFGRNDFGQLGLGDDIDRLEPTRIDALQGRNLVSLACGQLHSVFVSSDGMALACGKNDFGQLGLMGGEQEECLRVPMRILGAVETTSVVEVKCGYFHTLLLATAATMQQHSGSSSRSQRNAATSPGPGVPSSSSSSSCTSSSASSSLTIGAPKVVWAFGQNGYGQLGLGHNEEVFGPQRVSDLDGKEIKTLAAGCYHSVAISEDGNLYMFGRNKYGQLGTGDTNEKHSIYKIDMFEGQNVASVAAGFYHTAVLVGNPPKQQVGLFDHPRVKRSRAFPLTSQTALHNSTAHSRSTEGRAGKEA